MHPMTGGPSWLDNRIYLSASVNTLLPCETSGKALVMKNRDRELFVGAISPWKDFWVDANCMILKKLGLTQIIFAALTRDSALLHEVRAKMRHHHREMVALVLLMSETLPSAGLRVLRPAWNPTHQLHWPYPSCDAPCSISLPLLLIFVVLCILSGIY